MIKRLQAYYLQQMNIPHYVIRSSSPSNDLEKLKQQISSCTQCDLYSERTQTVFARGNPKSPLMIIGEAPGFHEDKQGLPFVGKAGILLDKMLAAIGLSPGDVYITNLLKCRPPHNRDPQADEIALCSQYLIQQIQLAAPQLVLGLGRFAAQFLTNQSSPIKQLRNTLHHYQGIPCVISYHPAYLLRNPAQKRDAYRDLLTIRARLDSL